MVQLQTRIVQELLPLPGHPVEADRIAAPQLAASPPAMVLLSESRTDALTHYYLFAIDTCMYTHIHIYIYIYIHICLY